ncbi:cytochrome P450 [Actinomadura xylanilytica]|uniref:cytochrome P450 n=1 Tax=Actinomadura xylanilytica TaxID=887459 RepID=UPI00255B2D74|nr:cytochrome P450 [Actinomadura xylanilytica]MDL4775913.1 cytochrome P450 [Actinomadura xylanilytica]
MPQRRGALPISDTEVLGCPDSYARGVPYERLERLRAKTPVVWLDGRMSERPGAWAVLSYADVRHALVHPELFASEQDGALHGPAVGREQDADEAAGGSGGGDEPDPSLIDMDPPARAMLERVPARESVDFVRDVAGDVPATLRNTLAGGLYALLRHPGQYERLQAGRTDEGLLDSAVEEMLRWWTPVMQIDRVVQRATEMGGVPLRAGERIVLWLASANHDEDTFPEPDRYIPERYVPAPRPQEDDPDAGHRLQSDPDAEPSLRHDRPARPHLCFGYGTRACLGARLTRVHLRALLVAILERPGRARLAGEPVMLRSSARHGFDRLPIRWIG